MKLKLFTLLIGYDKVSKKNVVIKMVTKASTVLHSKFASILFYYPVQSIP